MVETWAGSPIRESLRGKRVLLTGVTGFLGQALLERLLFDVPEVGIAVLVRGKHGQPAAARFEALFNGSAFERLRQREGTDGIQRIIESIEVLEGDVEGDLPEIPGDLDVVFHNAASVSFDPPIDEAFRTNVLGATALYEAVAAAGGSPHLVHVSTAYVAGVAKGVVPESPLEHDIDWREETEAAMAARHAVEAQSRKPELLDRFLARARREHGRAGPKVVSEHAEERRREWVRRRLVEYGRARAQTLGWPDVYTLTKALGERAVEELAARNSLRLSVVRPSIVESAYEVPSSGWIEGFKMADPIILAYGRGAIPEFPGIPEGVLDLIPVDFVVAAMLTVAANENHAGRGSAPAYFHVCSGSRNPLSFLRNYELVREYFQHHPLPERGRGEFGVPVWKFPGRRRVERRIRTGERLIDTVDSLVSRLPRSPRVRGVVRNLDRLRGRLEFVRRYADLYGAYVEAEVIYTDERTLELYRSLPEEDRRAFPFDCELIDWAHYLQDVHCPVITIALRFPGPARSEPEVRIRPRENGVVLAVFDMEGTIISSNVVESYLWLRLADSPREDWAGEVAKLARAMPSYLGAERRDRGEFLRAFYRRYEGASVEGVHQLVQDRVAALLMQRMSPAALRRVRQHRAAGHRTVLITGALEPFVEPLRPLFDEIVATRLHARDGRFTGYLDSPPLVGEARAAWLRRYAGGEGADLAQSYAYADSHTDLPLLRAVGNPVAVNPDVSLFRVARTHRWPVEEWHASAGSPKVLTPEAVS